jgi:hypothetical protein
LTTVSLNGSAVGQNTVSAPYACDKSTTVPMVAIVETDEGDGAHAGRPTASASTMSLCEVMAGS